MQKYQVFMFLQQSSAVEIHHLTFYFGNAFKGVHDGEHVHIGSGHCPYPT
jgi:hypothetical protein